MFLSLGDSRRKLGGTSHDEELIQAKAAAAARWERLLDLEGQVQWEEQHLAARPKKRPQAPGDDLIASEVIKRMEDAFATETDGLSAALADLRELAKKERRELESFITK